VSYDEARELLLKAGVEADYLDANPEAVRWASITLEVIQKKFAEILAEKLIAELFKDEKFAKLVPR
jgi:hypothetical protein